MGIGGGIVHDSVVHASGIPESVLKSTFLTNTAHDFRLFETLRYDRDNGFYLLQQHLNRLADSAGTLGFVYDKAAVRQALDDAVSLPDSAHLRVKLLLSPDGRPEVVAEPFAHELIGQSIRFALAHLTVDSRNLLLLHKTTRRAFLDETCAEMRRTTGCDEVLFLNERGELTQGSYTNLFIKPRNGKTWLTPPLSCGLLPGTLRAFLLESGEAEERVLYLRDIEDAGAVALGNALRGLVPGSFCR